MGAVRTGRFLWLLAAATLLPIAILTWLGALVLRADHAAERQRRSDRLNVAAQQVAFALERRLEDIEDRLGRGEGVRLAPDGPVSSAAVPLMYRPSVPEASSDVLSALREAEAAEYHRRDTRKAADAFRILSRSNNHELKAAALVGLARVLRKQRDREGALNAYAELQRLDTVVVDGQPAGLAARLGRARLFEELGDRAHLSEAAHEFERALHAGGWAIDRATFQTDEELLSRWGAAPAARELIARTEAAIRLWQTWRAGDLAPHGRWLRRESAPVLVVWSGAPSQPVVWLGSLGDLEQMVAAIAHGMRVSLHDAEGEPLIGERLSDGLSLLPGDTRLPFVLTVAAADPAGGAGESLRRLVFVSSLGGAFLLTIAAAYGVYRTTSRQLALAREQTDFVSAVSHEFRTPLTSMRHLMDLLVSRGVTNEERRTHYYTLLAHETERLHRMVEALLSFGRMEAGAYAWRLDTVDLGAMVNRVTEDFRGELRTKNRDITVEIEERLPLARVDRDAMTRAVWNLLENADKYSLADAPIRVSVGCRQSWLRIAVRDQGRGIPLRDRQRIFDKFVRGADVVRAGIGGVGIGLALVSRIVEAHGGRVELESDEGKGSTFTIVLPAERLPDGAAEPTADGGVHASPAELCH